MRYGRVLTLSLYLTGIAGCGGGSGGGSDGRSPPPPVISIDIGQAPSASEGEPSRSAMATLRWGISSTDSTQQAVSYSIAVSQAAVSVSPATGTVGVNDDIETALEADCPDQAQINATITIAVGQTRRSAAWTVTCRAGNAAFFGGEFYQGPLTQTWDWISGSSTRYVDSVIGRRVAMVVSITHESPTVPSLVARVYGGSETELNGNVPPLLEPMTVAASESESGFWETAYTLELSGDLFRPGNRVSYEIDPQNELDETNEEDNSKSIQFSSLGSGFVTVPRFRITFIPIRVDQTEAMIEDLEPYTKHIYDFFPIADDYDAQIGDTLTYQGEVWDRRAAVSQLFHHWNTFAQADEYYLGIFKWMEGACGRAWLGSNVAVAGTLIDPITFSGCRDNIYSHEVGHNFGLEHPAGAGCDEDGRLDYSFPYEFAGIGPHRGWFFSQGNFVSPDDGYFDTMSYCEPNFISDYNYQEAMEFRGRTISASGPPGEQAASQQPANESVVQESDEPSLVLTGSVDGQGIWSLDIVSTSDSAPRSPTSEGLFTISLLDQSGVELHSEQVDVYASSEGAEAVWGVRVPMPERPARFLVIQDDSGSVILIYEFTVDERVPMVPIVRASPSA